MTTDLHEAAPARAPRRKRAAPVVAAPADNDVKVIGSMDAALDSAAAALPAEDIHQRIGSLTRVLHDALRELGYDKDLAAARENLPHARDRLAYIARVTGEAAENVLNAVDHARGLQEALASQTATLAARWQAVATYTAGTGIERATPAGRQLVAETCAFFASLGSQNDRTQAILTDIMMAQGFHDLTGQVIRKLVSLAQVMEEQLVQLLIETTPPGQLRRVELEQLAGPVVKPEGREDVVTNQAQVDDLLDSLGF